MKRGQMGDADKHATRRKIEEKQVLVREHRKVRERLSRECADTIFHIASTESAIKNMTAKHKELLINKEEDFQYATAASRREIQQLEDKCAELQRILASSDVVEREQSVLAARLAALRADDEKEELENVRELDGLRRNLFNARNDLENVFRTTLHDLHVAYEDQAFDAMVEEARKAREDLPALRRDLRKKTSTVIRVMAKHGGSFAGTLNAKAERDLTDSFVRLQAQRGEKLRQSLEGQKEVIDREAEEMKDLVGRLETFQAEAGELRVAAAELKELRAESAHAHEEYLQARNWAEKLAKKGPRALKTELKRRRLTSLTAAVVNSFKTCGQLEPGLNLADTGKNDILVQLLQSQDHAIDRSSDSDRKYDQWHRTDRREKEHEEHEKDEKGGKREEEGADCKADDTEVGQTHANNDRGTSNQLGGVPCDGHDRQSSQQLEGENSGNVDSERIWRASLSGLHGNESHVQNHTNSTKNFRGMEKRLKSLGGGVKRSSSASWRALPPPALDWGQHRMKTASLCSGRNTIARSLSALKGVVNHITEATLTGDEPERSTNQAETAKASSLPDDTVVGGGVPLSRSKPPAKLPAEAIASMLFSEHKLGACDVTLSAAEALTYARDWEKQPQFINQEQVQQALTPSQPIPDLPYGFTDLGRRVNVGGQNHHGRSDGAGP